VLFNGHAVLNNERPTGRPLGDFPRKPIEEERRAPRGGISFGGKEVRTDRTRTDVSGYVRRKPGGRGLPSRSYFDEKSEKHRSACSKHRGQRSTSVHDDVVRSVFVFRKRNRHRQPPPTGLVIRYETRTRSTNDICTIFARVRRARSSSKHRAGRMRAHVERYAHVLLQPRRRTSLTGFPMATVPRPARSSADSSATDAGHFSRLRPSA